MKTYRDLTTEVGEQHDDSEALFEMANLVGNRTGLPFVVWISPRGNARHDVRVSRGARAIPSEMVSVAVRPNVHVVEGNLSGSDLALSGSDLALLQKWVDLNRDVLVRYWDGDIESTEDTINAIRPIQR
jgi:hypothetical protein